MLSFLRACGPTGYILLFLTLLNLTLVIRRGVQLATRKASPGPSQTNAINAILFWGVIAAVLGFLGQATGMYNALTVISQAEQISPTVVARGFMESFSTTLFGLALLLVSALAWYALRSWSERVANPSEST